MHQESLSSMERFVREYLDKDKKLKVLEVGSKKILPRSGTFRNYFEGNKNWIYVGMDVEAGDNVDVVSKDLYNYPFEDNSFDVVICANTIEHIQDIYRFIKELARITRDYLYIDAPNNWKLHRYPVDCWRIMPDGMIFLLREIAGLKVIFCHRGHKFNGTKNSTIGIARKI